MRRIFLIALLPVAAALAQLSGSFSASPDHPAIQYDTRPANDAVAALNRKIQEGKVQLRFEGPSGYLRSVLDALRIPIESQLVVFSKTSLQAPIITPANPRSLFFNDSVAAGWVKGEPFVEVAAEDPEQGMIFYTLDQVPAAKPVFERQDRCLQCHESQQGPFVFEHEAIHEGCTICHSPHGSINAKLLTERNSNLCMKCHFQQVQPGGGILIGGIDHTTKINQGSCWSAGCHEAVHGSRVSPTLRF